MANRFWVGGTASWDATAGTKWATTSGGAGGAAVPTSADDVFFDAASGVVTCTVTSSVCANLNFTGFSGTFAGSPGLNIHGSLTAVSGMTWTFTGDLNFLASSGSLTITTAGKTVGALFFGSAITTATWTLGSALTSSGAITVTRGTFTTNNYNVTATALNSTNANTRTINLGSSTVTLSGANAIDLTTASNLTFNAGTSSIVLTGATSRIFGNTIPGISVTFYNVSFTSTALTNGNIQGIYNSNIFNNLQVSGTAAAGVSIVNIGAGFVVNGTLSTTGTAGNRRVWFRGTTYGLAQTLTINSAPSLTDADFRDIYVIGTAAPISGTRIGDLRGIRGITASTPKTVYWNLAGTQNWSATAWATTPTGTPSTDNFPLAQDTATFTDAGSVTGPISMDAGAVPYTGTVDMSGRTSAMTLVLGTFAVYGNWITGSGITYSGSGTPTFSGRNTQTITSAGKAFSGGIIVDSYGGSVELVDALNIGSQTLTVTNGTFDTKNYNVTAGSLVSNNSLVRTITLGSSTVTLSSTVTFTTSTNLTFNAGTSSVSLPSGPFNGGGQTFYSVSFTSTSAGTTSINQSNTFTNLSLTATSSAGIRQHAFDSNQTITGTLTAAGASAVRRISLQSSVLGTARTLTVGTLAATDCDFRDITMAGAAAGSSPTRAGDCGGNTSITFSTKTVYWNLAGAQNWSADGWATSSGGTPATNNFPLAQDTATFDNTGSVTGTITIDAAWNIGTFNASARSIAMTLAVNTGPIVYGNVTLSSAVTVSGASGWTFSGRGTSTITSAGVVFPGPFTVDCVTGTVQLADAITVVNLNITTGVFDAVTYNVTITGAFSAVGANATLKMGTGTWTLSGTGTVWSLNSTAVFYKGTANIVLSATSTTARTFAGGSQSYNKLTIGGATGISTLTITGANQFTELASTKTVAHTISSTEAQTLGAWTVTGTVGNVVTLTGTATITIAGARVSGVDYLALGTTTISTTSPGEFYAGANSTGGTNAILTAAPSATTRYWRGGTGTWDATTTTNWATTSGGAGPASVPTSADAVIFDSLSNATAYTVTCTATQLRCAALTMAGPAVGNVTFAGTAPLAIHGNTSLAATGITRSYTGAITLSGSSTGRTLTTNGVALASATTVNGVGCGWTLGSALDIGSNVFTLTNGEFDTASYAISLARFVNVAGGNTTALTLGSSTVTATAEGLQINGRGFTLNAGTSQFNLSSGSVTLGALAGDPVTFYNVTLTNTAATQSEFYGANTFNNLTFAGRTSAGITPIIFRANQTINGTLTLSAGTNATMRQFLRSDTLGTTRTLTCAAFAGTDADFRDITIAGAAAPVSGTRLGDAKGNSGITFGAGVTRYWNLAAGGNWSATGWAATSGGSPAVNNFPLAQDTCLFEATGLTSGNTVTINDSYNIGTINMSARTSNTMTLATGSTTPTIYGNWINGTGTTLSGTGIVTFAGRGSQAITSAGRTFEQPFTINTPGGVVTLQDAYTFSIIGSTSFTLSNGTFNANNYNVTFSGANTSFSSTVSTTRTLALGSGTWSLAGTVWSTNGGLTGLTITGTGTISMTSASAKTFAGGGSAQYSGITLNQGGAGALTITGNNTFANISNTYKATGATNITLGTTTQTVGSFTASGEVGRVLTVQGTSASSPGTLILSSGTVTAPDYLAITGVRAYNLSSTWYAGANSTNNGSLGWIFSAGAANGGNFFLIFG
jgi:hypothetical protein